MGPDGLTTEKKKKKKSELGVGAVSRGLKKYRCRGAPWARKFGFERPETRRAWRERHEEAREEKRKVRVTSQTDCLPRMGE